ncbi:uncharacterized protein LOC134196384 [Corticium candelabrum]|uniref:uncharacterized protein LOC134196384 n=1 Tax=Corticium candelabrum TaxID=121492 RepID=UPI002E27690E|nr:uncharacterized protein LOC134196384 [Corticium candelabrum]
MAFPRDEMMLSGETDDEETLENLVEPESVRCSCRGKCARVRRDGRGCECKAAGAHCVSVCSCRPEICRNRGESCRGDGSHAGVLVGPPREVAPSADEIEMSKLSAVQVSPS